jgi:hypothetical protein
MPISNLKSIAGGLIAAVFLLVLLGLNQTHLSPEDAEDYHRAIRDAVNAIPHQIGPWEGADEEVTPAAIELLRPNIIMARRYTHQDTGQVVSLLIVHCKDARDLMGHYPPVCYPAQGWRVVESYEPVNRIFENEAERTGWALYPFTHGSTSDGRVKMMVYNKMLLPNGSATTRMDVVHTVAGDFQRRHYGAAALQIIVNEGFMPKGEASMELLLRALSPLRQAVYAASESK